MTSTATHACGGTGACGATGSCGSATGCDHEHGPPELDARLIHPAIRQSAIFGVLIGLAPDAAVTIVSDQDPEPITALVQERLPGSYSVDTEQVGDREWRVLFARA